MKRAEHFFAGHS
jgi:hypothetical protein